MMSKKFIKMLAAALACACTFATVGCGTQPATNPVEADDEFTVTIFSDVHHGDHNYNDFNCTRALEKLQLILDETPNSEFYVNLGDMADYLKNGTIDFYDEIAKVLHDNELNIYNERQENYVKGWRTIYNLMGNHETAYVPKSALSKYIPYVENVGSVYSFKYKGILFIAIDANFDRQTESDECSVMRTSTKFIIPPQVLDWAKREAAANVTSDIKGIVWLSHIAFKDIENTSRFALVDELNRYGLPLTVFEGHTHSESFDSWFDDDNPEKTICTIYTLPAVTSGVTYKYYNVTFKGGKVKNIDKRFDGTIE